MLDLAPPAALILPDHWQGKRPAIIRPGDDIIAHQRREARRLGMLPGMVPAIGGGGPRLTYLGLLTLNGTQTTYSLGSVSAPRAGLLIVGAGSLSGGSINRTLSSISIGGSAGTLHTSSGSVSQPTGMASRLVGAGSQAIAVTFSGSTTAGAAAAVWLLEGYASATPTASATSADNTSNTSESVTLAFPAGGAGAFFHFHWGDTTTTWTNATEDVDQTFGNFGGGASAASYRAAGAEASRTVTAAFANQNSGTCGAVWR